MIRKIIGVVLLVILMLSIWQYQLVHYGLVQARGQLSIIANTRSVEDVLQDPEVPDSIKQKLIFIQEVRQYAFDSLGINDSKNYTTFYDQRGMPSLWVVTAAEPFALKAREWRFPLLGGFPYKGFFDYEMAQAEARRLEEDSLDVHIGVVGGWSTLGWFRDPILSNMLSRKKGDLANLIIHELTHGTLFVKDSVEFNENLATFIGDEGAKRFLRSRYGEDSEDYSVYVQDKEDFEKYTDHILRGCDALESLYNGFESHLSHADRKSKKDELIEEIITNIDTISFHNPSRFIWSNISKPNNAFFMSYIRYRAKQGNFGKELVENFNDDLAMYMEHLKMKYPSL